MTDDSRSLPLRRLAVPVFGPSLLFGLGEGAILPIVPLAARELGASVPVAALAVMLIGAGALVSNIPASLITIRRGERWALVAAALWCAAAMALCAWTRHLALFAVGCFMVGMAQAVFGLARQSYLTVAVPVAFRARALSTLGGTMRIGMFLGPFAAAAAMQWLGLAGAYAVGIGAVLLAALLASRSPELPAETVAAGDIAPRGAPSLRTTLRDHRRVFLTLGVGAMMVAAVRATRQVAIPLWADSLGLGPAAASLIYGLSSGIDMLVFYPAGKVMDTKGRHWVAVPSMIVMGVALLLMPLASDATALLIAAMVLGFGNGIGSGVLMTIGADRSPRVGRAHFLGVWRLLTDVGSTCGPALLSVLTAAFSLGAGIAATGVIALAAAAQLGHWLTRRHEDEPMP